MNNTYQIKSGDTLSGIALRNNTTIGELLKLNTGITDPNKIFAGATLNLPTVKTNMQTTTAQRTQDNKTIADYNNILTTQGVNTVINPNLNQQQQNQQQQNQNQNPNLNQNQTTKVENPKALIDSLYLSGNLTAEDILKNSNNSLDLDTVRTRLSQLESDPVYKQNAEIKVQLDKQLKQLDTDKLNLDTKFEEMKRTMDTENKLAVESIQATYRSRREELAKAYTYMKGAREKMGYQTDSFRYTPMQQEGLVNNDEQNKIMKLAELDAEEKSLLLQASKAKTASDWDLLEKSVQMYNTINDNRKAVLTDLLKVSVENNKRIAEENKILAEANNPFSDKKMKQAENVAISLAEQVAGLTKSERDKLLKEYATINKIDYNALNSKVSEAEMQAKKDKLSIAKSNKTLAGGTKASKNTADKDIGSAVVYFQTNGVDENTFKETTNYLLTEYGYSAVEKLKDALDNEGISY